MTPLLLSRLPASGPTHLRHAFTLIEMLIVVAIIGVLVGMSMPMINVVQRQAAQTLTRSILSKTDSALRQFRQEFGTYPYQSQYPDLESGETFLDKPNHLYHSLGSTMTDDQRVAICADMQAAAHAFAYNLSSINALIEGVQPSQVTFTHALLPGDPCLPVVANRIAGERARIAVLAGNLTQHGPRLLNPDGTLAHDGSAFQILNSPRSASCPGWASDYLRGELPASCLRGDTILDAYHHPLIYINQTMPGIRGTLFNILGDNLAPPDTRFWGQGTDGFDPTTGPCASVLALGRGLLLQNGRLLVSASDAGDGVATPTDPVYFPDASRPLHCDMRFYCAPGYEGDFELWSAGPDGRLEFMRDDPANRDNLSLLPYNQGLVP